MSLSLSLLKNGDKDVDNFNTPLEQLNQGKEDRIPLPTRPGLVLTSDISGNKSWIETINLGETEDTAFRGDYGNIAYKHSQTPHDYYPKTGGVISGNIILNSGSLVFNNSNNISSTPSDINITTNGFCTLTGLGLKLSKDNDISVRQFSDIDTTGIGFYKDSNYISIGEWNQGKGTLDEMVLSSNSNKIYIKDELRTKKITTDELNAGNSSLNNQGLNINGINVINSSGVVSGVNVDLSPDYESSWIYVSSSQEITIPHNMNIRPKFSQILFSTDNSNDINKTVYTIPNLNIPSSNRWVWWSTYWNNAYTFINWYNNLNYCIKTGSGGVHNDGNNIHSSGYVKILLWK